MHDRGSNLIISVHDGTGELEVAHWLNEESEQVGGVLERAVCGGTRGCPMHNSAVGAAADMQGTAP